MLRTHKEIVMVWKILAIIAVIFSSIAAIVKIRVSIPSDQEGVPLCQLEPQGLPEEVKEKFLGRPDHEGPDE